MTVADKINKVYNALINRINEKINTHNSDSSAHSTEMSKKLNKAQGSSNASKNVVTDSSGNITTESKITQVSSLSNDAGYLTSVGWGQITQKPFSSIDDTLNNSSTNPVQNKIITNTLNQKANTSDIPIKTSDLTNDSNFLTEDDVENMVGLSYDDTTGILTLTIDME